MKYVLTKHPITLTEAAFDLVTSMNQTCLTSMIFCFTRKTLTSPSPSQEKKNYRLASYTLIILPMHYIFFFRRYIYFWNFLYFSDFLDNIICNHLQYGMQQLEKSPKTLLRILLENFVVGYQKSVLLIGDRGYNFFLSYHNYFFKHRPLFKYGEK